MTNWRGVTLVLLILGVGLAVGAVAGYRMHVQQEWQAHGAPVNATVTIRWPDASLFSANVTLEPGNATALGALQAAADLGNFTVVTTFFKDFGGDYVYSIDGHEAPRHGTCGWMYGIGGEEVTHRADRAADRVWLDENALVAWYWGCL